MNQETRYALAFYNVTLIIRDSLEYAIPNAKLAVENYNNRKTMLAHLLEENSPIEFFCKNNGETGAKIKSKSTMTKFQLNKA